VNTGEARRDVVTAPHELLRRMGATLRSDIAPAVSSEQRTQAFMAAVVLQKLARQLELAEHHGRATRLERAALVADLRELSSGVHQAAVASGIERLADEDGPAPLSALIRLLYEQRSALGADRAQQMLDRVRRALRADIDRRLEFAE
jgi:hypothetical protein